MLESDKKYFVTACPDGFYVNESTTKHFNPNINSKWSLYHSLAGLFSAVSPSISWMISAIVHHLHGSYRAITVRQHGNRARFNKLPRLRRNSATTARHLTLHAPITLSSTRPKCHLDTRRSAPTSARISKRCSPTATSAIRSRFTPCPFPSGRGCPLTRRTRTISIGAKIPAWW